MAAHPGLSNTELGRNLPTAVRAVTDRIGRFVSQSPAMGALPTLRAATDPAVVGGQYFGPGGLAGMVGNPVLITSSKQSHDSDLQRRLWAVSEELTGVTYPI